MRNYIDTELIRADNVRAKDLIAGNRVSNLIKHATKDFGLYNLTVSKPPAVFVCARNIARTIVMEVSASENNNTVYHHFKISLKKGLPSKRKLKRLISNDVDVQNTQFNRQLRKWQ